MYIYSCMKNSTGIRISIFVLKSLRNSLDFLNMLDYLAKLSISLLLLTRERLKASQLFEKKYENSDPCRILLSLIT